MRISSSSSFLIASLALSSSAAPVSDADASVNRPRSSSISVAGNSKVAESMSHLGRSNDGTEALARREDSALCQLQQIMTGLPIVGPSLTPMTEALSMCPDSANTASAAETLSAEGLPDALCSIQKIISSLPLLGGVLDPIVAKLGLCPATASEASVSPSIGLLSASQLQEIAEAVSKAADSIQGAMATDGKLAERAMPTTPVGVPAPPVGVPAPPAGMPTPPVGLPAPPVGMPAGVPVSLTYPVNPPNTPNSSSSSVMSSSTQLASRAVMEELTAFFSTSTTLESSSSASPSSSSTFLGARQIKAPSVPAPISSIMGAAPIPTPHSPSSASVSPMPSGTQTGSVASSQSMVARADPSPPSIPAPPVKPPVKPPVNGAPVPVKGAPIPMKSSGATQSSTSVQATASSSASSA